MNNYVISDQFLTAAASLLFGIAFAVIWDIFRVVRVLIGITPSVGSGKLYGKKMRLSGFVYKKPRCGRFAGFLVAIGDVMFFTLWGASFAVLTCHASSGHIRWYSLIPMLCGFAAYYFTCGKLVMSASHYAAFALWVVGGYIIYFVSIPFIMLYRLVMTVVKAFVKKAVRPAAAAARRHADIRRTKKMIAEAGHYAILPGDFSDF